MYEVQEKDWKLLRKRVPIWQETHMAKLNKEYIEILTNDDAPSKKFWELENRIYHDKKTIGVVIRMSRSLMVQNICQFLNDEVITYDDLEGFSEELISTIKRIME